MDFSTARYLTSAGRPDQLPPDRGREVAFAGRSNAGKSSAINAIAGRRGLARTSRTPGRTRELVVFELGPERRLVDLPGYGYARVPEAVRRRWDATLDAYFRSRRSLRGLVLIMDARHPLKPFDTALLDWCREADLPCLVLLNKADKLKRGAAAGVLQEVSRALMAGDRQGTVLLFSGRTGQGTEQARAHLSSWLD